MTVQAPDVARPVDRPALGAFLSTAEMQERLDRRRWLYGMSRTDYAARSRAVADLIKICNGLIAGRRLDLVADDLLILVTRIENVKQLHAGGWPVYPWLLGIAP